MQELRFLHLPEHVVEPLACGFDKFGGDALLQPFQIFYVLLHKLKNLLHGPGFEAHLVFVVHLKNTDGHAFVGNGVDYAHNVVVVKRVLPAAVFFFGFFPGPAHIQHVFKNGNGAGITVSVFVNAALNGVCQ